tara:strand:- start:2077 stop:2346 length:270 start_codon:yes stop_codon:yes gene_type:complete
MSFIKDFLKKREINKIKKRIAKLQEQALSLQRNGNLRDYAFVVKEIEELSDDLVEKLDNKESLSYNKADTDFIDYDGMGNQGRFPTGKK